MKVCKVCQIEKNINDFYKSKNTLDGHLNNCISCVKEKQAKYREKNIEAVREKDRKRKLNDDHRLYMKKRNKTLMESKEHRNNVSVKIRKRRALDPQKYKAQTAVGNALRDGRLKKLPCEKCGITTNIHGHHEDYSKPLEVIWLCHRHHMDRHTEINEQKRGKNDKKN